MIRLKTCDHCGQKFNYESTQNMAKCPQCETVQTVPSMCRSFAFNPGDRKSCNNCVDKEECLAELQRLRKTA
jgi:predicted RNA-binding Zn-ribbon protein involved in translation (DUF1610 family)